MNTKEFLVAAVDAVSAGAAAVDQLAAKNDRWLFLAAIAVIIVGGFFIVKWGVQYLMKQNADLVGRLQGEQDCYQEKLEKIVQEQNATAQTLVVCLDRNTAMGERNTEMLERCMDELKRIEG